MKLKRLALVLVLSLSMVAASVTTAFGCTSLFIGKNISANGSQYISRTEDMSDNYCKIFGIREAADHAEGEMFIADNGFEMPYPAHTLRYSFIRDSEGYGETVFDEDGNRIGEAYAAAGQNELGVSMTATVTTSTNSNTKRYDPLKKNGIAELSIPSVVLSVATDARHACEYLGSIIDQYGNAEPSSILISDAKESWDFETLSGTQWVALKLDDKRAAMNPNLSLMQGIDITDTENVICSERLVDLPREGGWLVTDENGLIEVAKTYGSGYQSYNTRVYQGLFLLNRPLADAMKPAANGEPSTVDADHPNPFYVDPTWKLGLLDMIHFQGYRGKGSEEDQDGTHRSRSVRSIGTNAQTECHIFETRQDMPLEIATIQWECNQDAEFGVFLPHFTALMTEVDKSYNETATRYTRVAHGTSMNWNIARINDLCNRNRTLKVGDAVREYFDVYQQSLIDQQAVVDEAMKAALAESKEKATEYANALSKDITRQTLEMTTLVIDELEAYIAGDHAEPFVISDRVKSISPIYAVPEEGIEECRAEAIATFEQYHKVDYLPEQWEEVESLIASYTETINASNTQERVENVLTEAVKDISAVKTADEVIAQKEAVAEAAEETAQDAAEDARQADIAATSAQDAADSAAAAAQAAAATAQTAAAAAQAAADAAADDPENEDLAAAAADAAQAAADAQAAAEAAAQAAEAAQAKADAAKTQAEIAYAVSDAKAAEAAAAKADLVAAKAQADAVKANEIAATAQADAAAAQADAEEANEIAAAAQAAADAAQAEAASANETAAAAQADAASAQADAASANEIAAAAQADAAAAQEAAEKAAADAAAAQEALDKTKAEDADLIAALQKEITNLKTTVAKNSVVSDLKVTQKSRKATVKFTKAAGASSYQIQYKLSSAKKWTNLKKSTTKAKAVTKKLKKSKKYNFRVRTITKVDGKNVYGKWTTKTIKIKKK